MKVFYFLLLLAFAAAVGLFAYQNNYSVSVHFVDRTWELMFPAMVAATYVLGMLSGWTVVGLLRRSWRRTWETQS